MNVLSQADIVKQYGISKSTANSWFKQALEGKNALEYQLVGSKVMLLDNPHNESVLINLKQNGQTFRNSVSLKKFDIPLDSELYSEFSDQQIYEYLMDLETKQERNLKWQYFGNGADLWDGYYKKDLAANDKTDSLLTLIADDILRLSNDKICVVDLGCGNGLPVKPFVEKINKINRLEGYFAVDISRRMAQIALDNIEQNLDTDSELFVLDLEHDNPLETFMQIKSQDTSNLILHVGNTLNNYDDRVSVLKNIKKGLGKEDLLVLTFSLDTVENRGYQSYVKSQAAMETGSYSLAILGIDIDSCEIRTYYDDKGRLKRKDMTLDKDYEITAQVFGRPVTVKLFKGQVIHRWKHYLLELEQFLAEVKQAGLTVATIKTDSKGNNAVAVLRA